MICMVWIGGCSSLNQISDRSVPQLLMQSQFPPIPETITQPVIDLDIVMFILEDGTVGKIRMLRGTEDSTWDSLVLSSMRQWRFTPAKMDNKPVGSWFHMKTTVRYANPQYMNLAEILCTTVEKADSVYDAIGQGQNFNELAMRCSVDPSREMSRMLGEVNINLYPESIRKRLSRLMPDEYTKPIQYGDLYAIFKRLKK
jgi:hypothetical protein